MKTILLAICIFGISSTKLLYAEGAARAPGMMNEKGQIDLPEIKFEYDSQFDLFKSADEARDYQSLFDQYKTSKEVTDHFTRLAEDKKAKMDEMRKSGKRPDMSRMKEEREAEKVSLLKDIKIILDKKKKDSAAKIALNEEVKCGGGKSLPVIEEATTASMKDATKVTKIILTEEELNKMKKDIKEEVKKEMMKEMADAKPRRDFKRDDEDGPGDKGDKEDRPKMAEGRGRKQMQGGLRPMGGGQSDSGMFSMASQMAAQIGTSQMMMGGNQMGQMNQMNNNQMNSNQMNNNQVTRDQLIQNQIRPPQMFWSKQAQPYANSYMGNNQMMPQMNRNQMSRPPMMNQNNNFQNQNYAYPQHAYQSNTDYNYGMVMNSQSSYNLMAPQMDYGYTGSNSPMSSGYSGYMNQQFQAAPSYTQYSFMGY